MIRLVAVLLLVGACRIPITTENTCGAYTDGSFHISTLDTALGCSYTEENGRVSVEGTDPYGSTKLAFVAPGGAGTFNCVPGTDVIKIEYIDKTGARFAAGSSDGSSPAMSGTCAITVQSGDESHWVGHVDAQVTAGVTSGVLVPISADVSLTRL